MWTETCLRSIRLRSVVSNSLQHGLLNLERGDNGSAHARSERKLENVQRSGDATGERKSSLLFSSRRGHTGTQGNEVQYTVYQMSRALDQDRSRSYKFTIALAVGFILPPLAQFPFLPSKLSFILHHNLSVNGLSVLLANDRDEEWCTSPVDREKSESMYIFLGNIPGQVLTDSMRCRPNDIS